MQRLGNMCAEHRVRPIGRGRCGCGVAMEGVAMVEGGGRVHILYDHFLWLAGVYYFGQNNYKMLAVCT